MPRITITSHTLGRRAIYKYLKSAFSLVILLNILTILTINASLYKTYISKAIPTYSLVGTCFDISVVFCMQLINNVLSKLS